MPLQTELFHFPASEKPEMLRLDMPDADVCVFPAWLPEEEANNAIETLYAELPWEQPEILIAGQTHLIPRMQVWCGNPGAAMRYSGRTFYPRPWHPLVSRIRERLEREYETGFNSALINLYRNGRDSVSWHADDEKELGPAPVIASLSLGATRLFKFKSKKITDLRGRAEARQLILKNGDLVIMRGGTQKHWLHCVPKCDISTPRRINLTFRVIAVMS